VSKIIAYTALHYGKDYLSWAIRSIIDYVDEYYVLYSALGSHGYRTSVPCPETRADLYPIAQKAAGDKLRWIDGNWSHEGEQRDAIHTVCPDADVILVLDADEIWNLETVALITSSIPHSSWQRVRLPMIHFWRSFNRAILHDPAYPERVIYPRLGGDKTETITSVTALTSDGFVKRQLGPICHMGYAQRPQIVNYKLLTHGHRGQFRTDCDWFNDKFMANAQQNTHPVGSEYWNPELVNPLDYMPAFMEDHPYLDEEVIE